MIDLRLDDLHIYLELKRRAEHSPMAMSLCGVLHPICGDAAQILEFVRVSSPGFTRHNIQHSFAIVDRIGRIMGREIIGLLTSAELFGFILAALFHDSGMTTFDGASPGDARASHATRSGALLASYLASRMQLFSEHTPRLASCTAFVMEAHALTWESMSARREFSVPNSVFNETFRCAVLAILLRIGDLLDLDSDRSCDPLRRHGAMYFQDKISAAHHDRHKRVVEFAYDRERIHIRVEPTTREEHQIWHEWLDYLKQDVLHANTYVFRGALAPFVLPVPSLELVPSRSASYDVWPLRFELDESGRLWDVVSQSIYTGRFDFVRELIQNAIDAGLAWMFSNDDAVISHPSPRSWSMRDYGADVVVCYSEKGRTLRVSDNGVGMSRDELASFLFRVACSGFGNAATDRAFAFPSIATFGIGFISVLVRAAHVEVTTRRRTRTVVDDTAGRRVTLVAGSRDAYVEHVDGLAFGTVVALRLREKYSADALEKWLSSAFCYTSAPITYINVDALRHLVEVAERLGSVVPASVARVATTGYVENSSDIHVANRFSGVVAEQISGLDHDDPLRAGLGRMKTPGLVINHGPLPTLPDKPAFAILAGRISLPPPGQPARPGRKEACVVWVPVALDDFELGVEWRSMHGFVAIAGEVCRVARVPPPDSTQGRTVIRAGADGISVRERDEASDSRLAGHEFSIPEYLEARYLARLQGDSEDVFESLSQSMLDEDFRAWMSDFGSLETFDTIELAERIPSAAFQDGILLPIEAWWVAPLGACRAVMNLTGGARLRLNVTRHTIDENPEMLRAWARAVAARVQEVVTREVVATFRHAGWNWEVNKVCPKDTGRVPSLRLHTEVELRRIVRTFRGKG